MIISKIKAVLACLFITSLSFGQVSTTTKVLTSPDSIPFILTKHNNISIQAIINDIDTVNLMLHTAANDVSLIEECVKKLSSINLDGSETVNSWGGSSSSKFSTKNVVQIGKFKVKNLTIWQNEKSGPNTDGKFGLNLFEEQIVAIDFDKKMMFVYNDWNESQALENGFEKFKLVSENGFLFISGTSLFDNKEVSSKFLIHSGFGGSILFDDQTTEKYQLSKNLKVIRESQLKDSYGNVLKTKKAILPEFIMANQELTNVPIGFFEGSIGRQKISVLGGDILKRFNIIFDRQNKNIYLKPNSLMEMPFSDI